MPPRETKEVPIGAHTFVIKTFASAREIEPLRKALHGQQVAPTFEVQQEAERQMINTLVVSVNAASTPNIADWCLDNLDYGSEYTPLIQELTEVITKKKN